MPSRRLFVRIAFVVALAMAVVSCADDSATGPTPPAQPLLGSLDSLVQPVAGSLLGTTSGAVQLLTCRPLPYASSSQLVGPAGGTITAGAVSLVVPRGALTGAVTITAEQISGSVNSVRFQPAGLRFARPAVLTMSYANCLPVPLPKTVVYTDEALDILQVLTGYDRIFQQRVVAPISHFSRYAVAW